MKELFIYAKDGHNHIVLCLLAAIVMMFWFALTDQIHIYDRFDPAVWASSPEKFRSEMADDLLKTHKFVGLRREEVEMLLGNPDDPHVAPGDFAYRLNRRASGKDCLYFAMRDGKVSKAFVSREKLTELSSEPPEVK